MIDLNALSGIQKLMALAFAAVIIMAAAVFLMTPKTKQGTWRYGACQVFLERHVRFPDTIDLIAVSETRVGAKIMFSHTNAYGYNQTQLMECIFENKNNAITMKKATIDRRNIEAKQVNEFNLSLPVVLKNLPDLAYPPRAPSRLEKIKK